MRHATSLQIGILFTGVLLAAGCGMGTLDGGDPGPVPVDLSDLKLSGPHYNLNIIGVPKGKTADMTGDNGQRIFVPRFGKATIDLVQGPTFEVLDANGTDGKASFQMPNPDPDGDGVTAYAVFARALGKPGGSSTTTTCLTDALGDTYCSIESMVLVRSSGKSNWQDVSKQLLSVYVDLNADGVLDRVSLFSDALANYYWEYDNNGLNLAQLRFYERTTLPAP
jgi:hypothetical protein